MVVSRNKQEVENSYSSLGIDEYVNLFVRLCKGVEHSKKYNWFYSLVINRLYGTRPCSIPEVKSILQDAWWIEEEDLQQEIAMICHSMQPSVAKYTSIKRQQLMVKIVANTMAIHLVFKYHLFARSNPEFQEQYRYYDACNKTSSLESKPSDLGLRSVVLDECPIPGMELSLFNRYLVYLNFVLNLPRQQVAKILLCNHKYVQNYNSILKKKLEEIHGCAKNSDGHC